MTVKTAAKFTSKTFKASTEDLKIIRELSKKTGIKGYSDLARLAFRSLAKEQGIRQ